MACFTCNENKSQTQVTVLLMYKEANKLTGKNYWFFKRESDNNVQIMDDGSFKQFKKENASDFKQKKYEFAHISEFRVIANS